MKIVYIEANPGNGGAEEYAINLAREARSVGHDIYFILGSENGAMVDTLRRDNFDILFLSMRSSFNPYLVLKAIFQVKKFIETEKVDIVHAQMLREQSLVVGAIVFGSKVRLVRTFHRLDQFNAKMKILMPLYHKYTDGFVAISEYLKEYLAINGIKRKVYTIHNGIRELDMSTKKKALGSIGRITTEKGLYQFVVKNYEKLSKEPLILGGDGPDRQKIINYVEKKKLNVKLPGQITDKDTFFKQFNVFILPSETEVLPTTVLEAFSIGTPVVAFDIPPLRGLINSENGALVKYGDYKKMADVAIELSKSSNYKHLSQNARETYLRGFTIDKMWYDTERLYKHLCQK